MKSITNVLHGQNGLALKLSLLSRPRTAVLSVPFYVGTPKRKIVECDDRPLDPTKRLSRLAPSHELDRARRTARVAAAAPDETRLASLQARQRVSVTGEITGTRVVPRDAGPWLELTVDDGSGSFTAMFTGRRSIPGIQSGRLIAFHGVLRQEHGRRVMLNPSYTLLAESPRP